MSTPLPELQPEPKRPIEHAMTLEKWFRTIAVYAIVLAFAVCMIQGGGLGKCCGPVNSFLEGSSGAVTTAPTPSSPSTEARP